VCFRLKRRERGSGPYRATLSAFPTTRNTTPERKQGTRRMDKRTGFTLIELLIVVVIIGILATIAIPKFSQAREKAFISTMKSDLKNLATHQEIYHNDNFSFSNSLTNLGATVSDGVTITINEATGSGWAATASHAGLVAQQCGIYQGTAAPAGGSPGPTEGSIACTM
jgi:type IV pilus assembly protein PilA